MSVFTVDAGAVGSTLPDTDFLDFNPPPPSVQAINWFHFFVDGTGSDSIGHYIDITVSNASSLNGIAGDINQDGFLTQDDIDAFVTNWRMNTSALSGVDRYKHGDLNADGITDLSDAQLLSLALGGSGSGLSFSPAALLGNVPEPGTLLLLSLASVLGCPLVRRRS